MSQISIIDRDNRKRQPSFNLACGIHPTTEQKECLMQFISSKHPEWSLNYCELRAVVEFMKGPV